MPEFTIIPVLGVKTDVPANDPTLFVPVGNFFATHDTGGLNFDLQRKRNSASKSYGYSEWSNSANAQATRCLGLYELYDGTNRNNIYFDNGKCYIYDGSKDPVVKEDAGTTTFANSANDLYSIVRVGDYMVFADRAEHTLYKWKHGDANLTKLIQSGTEYKFRYIEPFQRRVIGVYSDQTDGNIDIRWSTDWPTTAITSLNFPAENQLWMPNDDTITGIRKIGLDRCVIYGENSICEIYYYPDYSTPFRLYINVSDQGSFYHSIVSVGAFHYLFNKNYGFCMYRGGSSFPYNGKPISEDIESDLTAIDSAYYDLIYGRYIPWKRQVVWAVPLSGSSAVSHLLYYNIDTGQWTKENRVFQCLDTWTLTGNTVSALVYANTDGKLYEHTGADLAGSNLDGYRIEPIMDFGDYKTFKLLKEIWFDFGGTGNYSVDVYHRSGDTVGELLAQSWASIGSVSYNSSSRPILNCSQNARLHQIKWGTNLKDEPFEVKTMTFIYELGASV